MGTPYVDVPLDRGLLIKGTLQTRARTNIRANAGGRAGGKRKRFAQRSKRPRNLMRIQYNAQETSSKAEEAAEEAAEAAEEAEEAAEERTLVNDELSADALFIIEMTR